MFSIASLKSLDMPAFPFSADPNDHCETSIRAYRDILPLLQQVCQDKRPDELHIYDPYFKSETVFGHKIEDSISEAVSGSDAVIIITGHNEFDDFNFDVISDSMNTPILVDCTGKINPQNIKSEGVIFRGIGRGGL